MNLRDTISWLKTRIQEELFLHIEECVSDPLTEKQKRLITILEVMKIEDHVKSPEYQLHKAIGRRLHIKSVLHGIVVQFFTFAGMGVVGTTAHYAILFLLVETAIVRPVIASAFGFVTGATVNYY